MWKRYTHWPWDGLEITGLKIPYAGVETEFIRESTALNCGFQKSYEELEANAHEN
jgi:hypothetical protein